MNQVSVIEVVAAIICCAAVAGVFAYLFQWCWDEWHRLSELPDDEEDDESYYSTGWLDIPEPDENEPLPWEPVLLRNDAVEVGDKVYDTESHKVVTFCGKEDNKAVCVQQIGDSEINVYRCPMEQVVKVAE